MKASPKFHAGALAVVLCAAGCATSDPIKTTTESGSVNLAGAAGGQGYVEFTSRKNNALVPIYRQDDGYRMQLVGMIGLKSGTRYRTSRSEGEVPVVETLRVAVAPGLQKFIIQRDGKVITVPVVQDKVTPVEVDYLVIDAGTINEVYRVSTYVLEAIPASERPPAIVKQ